MDIISAISDPNLFGKAFGDLESWKSWIVCLKALFALEMTSEELEVFKIHTGRERPPSQPVREGFLIIGRRGGKSRIAALVTTFLACFRNYSFAPGEKGVAMLISVDRRQSRVCYRYVDGIFNSIPVLGDLIERRTADCIDLRNNVSIEIHTASFRSLRGYSVCCAVCDEISFWRSEESQNPDKEIIDSIRPGMSSVPSSMLIGISSPYSRKGVLWASYKKYYGVESDRVLIWVGDTMSMNPTVDPGIIDEAFAEDSVVAASEYGRDGTIQFRQDLESFVDRAVVEACVIQGRFELPYLKDFKYTAFCDPSGGSSDSMTLAIGHRENNRVVLDAIRERKPPFSPEDVILEFVQTLNTYRVQAVRGDKYGGEWPRERFRVSGIAYETAEKTKSEYYLNFLPLINSRSIEMLDHGKLVNQLVSLERRTGRSGKDSIDHTPGGHDDVVNSVAGVAVELSPSSGGARAFLDFFKADLEKARAEQ